MEIENDKDMENSEYFSLPHCRLLLYINDYNYILRNVCPSVCPSVVCGNNLFLR